MSIEIQRVVVIRVCPEPKELSEIKTNIPCPEDGCGRMFLNSSRLDMHLQKHHKKGNFDYSKKDCGGSLLYQYHCPVEKCSYNMKSDRFFKTMKYLKQHYLKVHAEKTFICEMCHKGFSTEAAKEKHIRICGVKFNCSCGFSYSSYEALLTHAKRHQHNFDAKYKLFGKGTQDDNTHDVSKLVGPVRLVVINNLSEPCLVNVEDKGVQTDARIDGKRSRKLSNAIKCSERAMKRRTSTQTQTGSVPRHKQAKISTQTQTIGDYILKTAMKEADILFVPKRYCSKNTSSHAEVLKRGKKSMETQTSAQLSHSSNIPSMIDGSNLSFQYGTQSSIIPSPSPFNVDIDVGLPDFWFNQKNTSGTQTSPIVFSDLLDYDLLNHCVNQSDLDRYSATTCEGSNLLSTSTSGLSLSTYFDETSQPDDPSSNLTQSSRVRSNYQDQLCSLDALTQIPSYDSPGLIKFFSLESDETIASTEEKSCNTETQTEIDLNNSLFADSPDDATFTLSNTETQTTEDISSFDHLLHSNMCTQTCDDFLFSDLGFANIQTQTSWPSYEEDSLLVSAETQTSLTGGLIPPITGNCKYYRNSNNLEKDISTAKFCNLFEELNKSNSHYELL